MLVQPKFLALICIGLVIASLAGPASAEIVSSPHSGGCHSHKAPTSPQCCQSSHDTVVPQVTVKVEVSPALVSALCDGTRPAVQQGPSSLLATSFAPAAKPPSNSPLRI